LAYFVAIWHILPPFGIFCGNLVHIFPLWYVKTRKIWQPWLGAVFTLAFTDRATCQISRLIRI
jgi:hypothetical protein